MYKMLVTERFFFLKMHIVLFFTCKFLNGVWIVKRVGLLEYCDSAILLYVFQWYLGE